MAPLRSASTAALELPAVDGRKRGAVQQTAAAAALPPQRAGRRLDASASAPSLTLAALSGQVHEMGETIEQRAADSSSNLQVSAVHDRAGLQARL